MYHVGRIIVVLFTNETMVGSCSHDFVRPTMRQRLFVKEGLALRLRWRAVGIIWFPRLWIGATSLEWWEFRRYQDGELLEYVHIPKEWPNLHTSAIELSTGGPQHVRVIQWPCEAFASRSSGYPRAPVPTRPMQWFQKSLRRQRCQSLGEMENLW